MKKSVRLFSFTWRQHGQETSDYIINVRLECVAGNTAWNAAGSTVHQQARGRA